VIPIFVHRMLRGETLTIYDDGEQTRDFVNVRDVARANILAAESHGLSGAFNVASGEAITVNRMVQLMREASGIEPSIKYAPPRKGDVRNSRADISAANTAFSYQPAVNLLDGLTEYMTWARSNLG
jgi:UDP-glucose 4-epimerase